ncbi:MAG: hypothetical protein JEZ10_00470 [Verrucomicrobia bacterium]|nr:hypothetical protein [Verrucomicrobiota bacterium]
MLTLLSLLLATVTAVSLLMIPASSQNRFRPIPAHAQLVYNNKNPDWFLSFFPMLGSREPRQAQNFPTLGKKGDDFSNVWKKSSKPRHSWFRALEKSPLTVATVAFGGREGRDAWVAVSELGGPAALALRWRLLLFPPEGVAVSRPYAVWPVWTFEHSSLPPWARVRFTLTDGLLICSISTDSHDIYKLIDTLDGRAASLADLRSPR